MFGINPNIYIFIYYKSNYHCKIYQYQWLDMFSIHYYTHKHTSIHITYMNTFCNNLFHVYYWRISRASNRAAENKQIKLNIYVWAKNPYTPALLRIIPTLNCPASCVWLVSGDADKWINHFKCLLELYLQTITLCPDEKQHKLKELWNMDKHNKKPFWFSLHARIESKLRTLKYSKVCRAGWWNLNFTVEKIETFRNWGEKCSRHPKLIQKCSSQRQPKVCGGVKSEYYRTAKGI